MTHKHTSSERVTLDWTTCGHCGKRSYPDKGRARRARKSMADDRLSIYRCKSGGPGYHVGHLPDAVRKGRVDRRLIVNKPRANP